ncbi:hypothetical protein F4777DRAFT_199155 [Nemania sp. FL0916]|nr:hypothetical protein F4777DRAFT_199155 [Nemania sp. FL0916]
MRLRQSNRKKRYGLPDYGLDLDTSDADSTRPRADSSEDEFVVDANAGDEEEAVGGHSELDEEEYNDDEAEENGFGACGSFSGSKVARTTKAKTTASGWSKEEHLSDNVFAEVPPYPSDPGQRWTRTYVGPIKRWTRFYELIDWWFGDKPDRRVILDSYLKIWWQHELIPPKLTSPTHLLIAQRGWMSEEFADEQRSKFRRLYNDRLIHQLQQQTSTPIDKAEAFNWFIPQAQGGLNVLLGHVSAQKPYHIQQGESISLSDTGLPIGNADDETAVTGGWLLDVGGIPTTIAWAPSQGHMSQLLAIAVAPFSDQTYYPDLKDSPNELEHSSGSIQILKFETIPDHQGIFRPSRCGPKLAQTVCFSWGRVSRMQWCPVPLAAEDAVRLLGVLCVDGRLRIVGIQNVADDNNELFEKIEESMILIEPPRECSLEITCFTWINMNRVAVGLSDGSVVLWSLSPLRMLQRHPVHSTAIMDIVSGFPSDPFLVSTIPIGGVLSLTNLNRPSSETTYHPNVMVSLQPHLLAWSPHLRGFASMWPSAFAGNPNLTFLPIRGFPLCRHLITVNGLPTCISMSPCHPYLLAGTTDGSIWVFNILRKLSSHREKTVKVKLFQHEFCAPPSSGSQNDEEGAQLRGVCRIIHGFLPELNSHPTGVKMAETQRLNREKNAKESTAKKKAKGKARGKSAKLEPTIPVQQEGEVDEEAAMTMTSGPGPIVLYEPQTRITGLAWNPNVEFSWWIAVAMGSGLVRIMDVGAEPQETEDDELDEQGENNASMDVLDEDDVKDSDVEMASEEE